MSDLVGIIQERGVEALGRYYSTYRGIVMSVDDPDKAGKIAVQVPSVHNITRWAFPKYHHGGPNTGFKYLTPPVNSIVYVEFENGDPNHPLWSYHGWAIGEIPEELDNPRTLGLVTPKGNKVYLNEDDGVLKVVTRGGTSMKMVIPGAETEDKADVTVDVNTEGVQVKSKNNVTLDCEGDIILNGGENLGLINIADLTSKLNELVGTVNALIQKHNLHVHICASPGSPSKPTDTPAETAEQFNKDDYEDTKVTH